MTVTALPESPVASVATQTVIGVSVSPQYLSAVLLSGEDFTVLGQAEMALPEDILTSDGQRILDIQALVAQLRLLRGALHLRDADGPVGVHLSVMPAVMDTQPLETRNPQAIRQELEQVVLTPDVIQQGILRDTEPLLQHTVMGGHDEDFLVGYALLGSQLMRDFEQAFAQAGFSLASVDLLPLCVLRGMAASGVLDALLNNIGPDGVWGCFGLVGGKTWVTLWQGTRLMELSSFSTPKSKQAWRNRLLTILELASVEEPDMWFSWQEPGAFAPISPVKLELKAPVKAVFLGPMYETALPSSAVFPALGAALKSDISFPLDWDFRPPAQPESSGFVGLSRLPGDSNLSTRVMVGAIALFLLTVGVTVMLWLQNRDTAEVLGLQNDQVKTVLHTLNADNALYDSVLVTLNTKSDAATGKKGGIQLEQIRVDRDHKLTLSGTVTEKASLERFIRSLNTLSTPDKVVFARPVFSSVDLPTHPPAIAFEYRADVLRPSEVKPQR